jgi:hypothetical protein
VVVGTCPDLGAIEPVAQPLRLLARRWSRDLAAAQTVAVVEAGGRAVSVGDLLSDAFSAEPTVMFSKDRFHPSPAGYARVAAALLPTVSAALDLFGERSAPTEPNLRRGESVGPVAKAAMRAVTQPGTEVAATRVAGDERGRQGRWAMLLRRRRQPLPEVEQPHADGEGEGDGDDRSALVTEPAVLAGETGGPGSNEGAVSNDAVEHTAPVEGKAQR